jgi:hypothetical protein
VCHHFQRRYSMLLSTWKLHQRTQGNLQTQHWTSTTQSDVGAGTSAKIINNQLKAVDFEDDIIVQWKPGHWSNLAKDTV